MSEEQEFEAELELLRREAQAAIQFFYAYLGVNAVVGSDREAYRLLNVDQFFATITGKIKRRKASA